MNAALLRADGSSQSLVTEGNGAMSRAQSDVEGGEVLISSLDECKDAGTKEVDESDKVRGH